jgi:hypothetical protein
MAAGKGNKEIGARPTPSCTAKQPLTKIFAIFLHKLDVF